MIPVSVAAISRNTPVSLPVVTPSHPCGQIDAGEKYPVLTVEVAEMVVLAKKIFPDGQQLGFRVTIGLYGPGATQLSPHVTKQLVCALFTLHGKQAA
jgi:hypothetical protein